MCTWNAYLVVNILRLVIYSIVAVMTTVAHYKIEGVGGTDPESSMSKGFAHTTRVVLIMSWIAVGLALLPCIVAGKKKPRPDKKLQGLAVALDIVNLVLWLLILSVGSVVFRDFLFNVGDGTCVHEFVEMKYQNGCLYTKKACAEELRMNSFLDSWRWQDAKVSCSNRPDVCGHDGRFCAFQRVYFGHQTDYDHYTAPCFWEEACWTPIQTSLDDKNKDEQYKSEYEKGVFKTETRVKIYQSYNIFHKQFYDVLYKAHSQYLGAFIMILVGEIFAWVCMVMSLVGICCHVFQRKEDERGEGLLPQQDNQYYGAT